jgi:hypothetical protein
LGSLPSETIFELGLDKQVGFHQTKETASTKMWEIANHGEFEEDQVQCGREYERQAW